MQAELKAAESAEPAQPAKPKRTRRSVKTAEAKSSAAKVDQAQIGVQPTTQDEESSRQQEPHKEASNEAKPETTEVKVDGKKDDSASS